MVGARSYDWMYRVWAPWDAAGVREDLMGVVKGRFQRTTQHRKVLEVVMGSARSRVGVPGRRR